MRDATAGGPGGLVERLCRAVNEHDLEALSACFASAYRNETPVHPARGFAGRAQVRRNWEQIFGGVPDISAEVRWIADDHTAWSEWEMRGTRGVVIFRVEGDEATWARFYLEPVQDDGEGVNEAVRRAVIVPSAADPASPQDPSGLGR